MLTAMSKKTDNTTLTRVDRETLERFKRLAGDMPVAAYLRELSLSLTGHPSIDERLTRIERLMELQTTPLSRIADKEASERVRKVLAPLYQEHLERVHSALSKMNEPTQEAISEAARIDALSEKQRQEVRERWAAQGIEPNLAKPIRKTRRSK